MRKKIIGLFLILVFSIQLLPVMQVGLVLANGQLTEEHCSINEDHPKGKEVTLHLHPTDIKFVSLYQQICMVQQNENFNSRHADDIQTPPPNVH